ncbi:MarR family winged helix-turn-helix transcriptional regulator [Nocardioides yefusunii]|uniref:MarR family winged helix-turn-helix transcriptional regulator n=1 Tax=Nocardioides yefusunii TaxID=2500546 RepID=A0ABW1R2D1_9ACTN|nr:MarR family transcriptional regulator [Nocardioides yefusunii]
MTPPSPTRAAFVDSDVASSLGSDIEQSVRLVRELTKLGVRLKNVASRHTGLSPADISALSILVKDVVGPADLARQLDVSTAAATGIVDRLAARGLVERHAIPDDRRRTALHITESGRAEHAHYLQRMADGLRELDRQFSDAERDVIERYLTGAVAAIADAVDEYGQDPSEDA